MSAAQIGYVNGDLDFRSYRFPVTACMVAKGGSRVIEASDTGYGYALRPCILETESGPFTLREGMYFSVAGPACITSIDGNPADQNESANAALLIVRHKYRGLLNIGGPIEDRGRLRYIDGCSDTLLVCPPRRGEPCLNYLHFPTNIDQTMHTHPSIRVGVVARGNGICRTPTDSFALKPGMLWLLPEDTPHAFMTTDETMDVIAWHPDSDTGPSDDDHPMINRTIVDGVSANKIDAIRTTGSIRAE